MRGRSSSAVTAVLFLLSAASAEARAKKRRPAAPAPAPAPQQEAAPAAPSLPDGPPRRLDCAAPEEVPAGAELTVECSPEPALMGLRVRLHYRAAGSEDFSGLPMEAGPGGGLVGRIPPAFVTPPTLQFHVQATDAAGNVFMTSGRSDSPNLVRVRAPAPLVTTAAAAAAGSGAPHTGPGRATGGFWLGLSIGSGYGWQPATRLENRADLRAEAGFAPAALGHFAPEVGYQLTRRWAVSLAGRHQFVPGGGDDDPAGAAHRWAHALLVRGHHTRERGPLLLYGVGQLGGGDGYRFRFSPDATAGRPAHDTTRAGPLVLGPGGGALYRLRENVAAVGEVNLLFGVPDFGALFDLNLGVQVDL